MSNYTERLCTPGDFARAFKYAHLMLKLKVMDESLNKRITDGMANDTVAAMLQARDLIATMHEVGISIHELQRWLVEWGREWKEQEEITKMEQQPVAKAA